MTSRAVLIMGVAGAGKTTIGRAYAARAGVPFLDADELHPPANVAKMRAGVPLQDVDRDGWIERVAERIGEWRSTERGGCVACSALRRKHRDRLRAADPGLLLVYLRVDPALARRRVAQRADHYFPESLMDSQWASLEPPQDGEDAAALDGALDAARLVDEIAQLARRSAV